MKGKQGGKRINTLTEVMRCICRVYVHARAGGVMSVKFFNEPQGRKDFTEAKVAKLTTYSPWKGVTRIGTELKRKILDNFVFDGTKVRDMKKPLLVVVITDGEVCPRDVTTGGNLEIDLSRRWKEREPGYLNISFGARLSRWPKKPKLEDMASDPLLKPVS
jgi:hypothetical protein